jgi:glycosyltransferase involved in cell wall biosynthesis
VIAQDRAQELRGLLANIEGVGDEVVVVDGGSGDETREVARSAGARVIESPWPGHWGLQKNVAYDAARGDWILNVDTDERVGERLRARLPELCASRRHAFYRLPMYWVTDLEPLRYLRSPQHYPCPVPRLFRNVPEHRYVADERLHPTFPEDVVRSMKKVRGAHLFHLVFVLNSRAAIEARMRAYEAQDPESRGTNRKYYPYWEIPHSIGLCEERF